MKCLGVVAGTLLAASVVVACGGDDDGSAPAADAGRPDAAPACEDTGGAACFELPVAEAKREDDSAPNWSCGAPVITTSTADITVSGTAFDFANDTKVIPNATITAFDGLDFSQPVATTTADANGVYSILLPAGKAKSRMNWRTSAATWLDTYAINFALDISGPTATMVERRAVGQDTAGGIAGFIGVIQTPGLGVLAGGAVDCERKTVKNVIATVSTTSSVGNAAPTFAPGAQVYYFSNGTPDFPVRRTSPENKATKGDGLFVAVEIPPTTAGQHYFLQIWGFKTAADVAQGMAGLSLLSQLESPVVGDSIISVEMSANQGQ